MTAESAQIEDRPLIPNLTFRHFRGDEDYPALLEVNNGSKIADGMDFDLHTLDTIAQVYGSTPNHDPTQDMLIAEISGKVVAFNRVFWVTELAGDRIYSHYGFVLPEWRGKGLGLAMLRWVEKRAYEIEATQPALGAPFASTVVHNNMPGLENLLKAESYEPVRYAFHMETPDLDNIPTASMPEGLEVRPVQPEHYHAIWEAAIEADKDEWGATEEAETLEDWLNDTDFQPDLWMVAWDGDQVAGMVRNFVKHGYNARAGRNLGFTEGVSVRRPWRRQGLARALLSRSMKMFKDMGMAQTALGVDTENPSSALRLYESMGYRAISQMTTYRKKL